MDPAAGTGPGTGLATSPVAAPDVPQLSPDLLDLIFWHYVADAKIEELCVRVGNWVEAVGGSTIWGRPSVQGGTEWERLARRVAIFLPDDVREKAAGALRATTWRKIFCTVSATLARWRGMKRHHQLKWYGWAVAERLALTPADAEEAARKQAWRRRCTFEWWERPLLCWGPLAPQMVLSMPFFFSGSTEVHQWDAQPHTNSAHNRNTEFENADNDLCQAVHHLNVRGAKRALNHGAAPTTWSRFTVAADAPVLLREDAPPFRDVDAPRVHPPLLHVAVDKATRLDALAQSGNQYLGQLAAAAAGGAAAVAGVAATVAANAPNTPGAVALGLHMAQGPAAGGGPPDFTELVHAAHTDILKLLIESPGAEVNATFKGATALHRACSHAKPSLDTIERLLARGADVHAEDGAGRTPLLALCSASLDRESMRCLLRANANVNVCDAEWDTPLHMAARAEKIGAVERLVEHGARVLACNRRGETASDIARASATQWSTDPRCELAARLEELARMELYGP